MHANAAQAGARPSGGEAEKAGLAGITSEQWQRLMEMLNIQKPDMGEKMTGKSHSNLWILDSGATNHMTGTLEIMRDYVTYKHALLGCQMDSTRVQLKKELSYWMER